MRWTEGDCGAQPQWSVIFLIQRPFLSDGGQYQDRFQPRERLADAAARAEAKWEIGQTRAVLGMRIGEALRIEAERIRPKERVSVHHPLAHEDDGAGNDLVRPEAQWLNHTPANRPHRWIKPHRLRQH